MSIVRRRLLDRKVNVRDAAIFYVATEDTHAAEQYFRALQQNGIIDRSRVQVVVLATKEGRSSPGWLVDRIAASNPCFEACLLLHETDDLSEVPIYKDDTQAAAACEAKLRRVLGSYSKRRLDSGRYTAERLALAESRAKSRDTGERWPRSAGSHVHRLTERLPKPRRAGRAD